MKFSKAVLPNGLTVLGEVDELLPSASVGVFVKTGARDETPDVSGVSHFLEHMMFKGTAKRSALDVTFDLGNIGAQANAYTSEEQTVYYASVVPEYFPQAVELLTDMLRPSLDEKEYDVEKKVILEEIALYQDRPTHVLFEKAVSLHFTGHGGGNSVLGSLDSIRALKRDQMKGYFDRRYVAPNMILAAAGKFSWSEFLELAEKYCASWPHVTVSRDTRANAPTKREETIRKDDQQMAHVVMVCDGPSAADPARYAAHLLGAILGDSTGSRVYWELVEKGLVESASIDCEPMDGTGMVVAYAGTAPENLKEVEKILSNILRAPADFSDGDLERAKNKFATRIVLQSESSRRRLMSLGLEWLYRGQYVPLAEEIAQIQAVSRSDIVKLLERYSFEPMTVARLLPKSSEHTGNAS